MNYVLGDIHNDNYRFKDIIQQINMSNDDHLFILGDLFDRCPSGADPVGVYFNVLKLGSAVTVIMGNHDLWLSQYIDTYYAVPERKRRKLQQYGYNSFELLRSRLTEVDMINLSEFIKSFPAQIELRGDTNFLLAHAMTCDPKEGKSLEFHTMGDAESDFYKMGVQGFVSVCGHTETSFMKQYGGRFSVDDKPSIWRNDLENLIMIDCGCGFSSGRLACLCLETGQEYYA